MLCMARNDSRDWKTRAAPRHERLASLCELRRRTVPRHHRHRGSQSSQLEIGRIGGSGSAGRAGRTEEANRTAATAAASYVH